MKRMVHVARAIVVGCSLVLPTAGSGAEDVRLEASARALPQFQLLDHTGEAFGPADMQDRWSLLFLGYTFCPDVCPMTLTELTGTLEAFSDRNPAMPLPQIVFLAVDPERDQEMLPDYVAAFHERTVGITGSTVEIDRVVQAMQGFYRLEAADQDGDYAVQHSASICVVDPQGRIVAKFNPPLNVEQAADALLMIMRSG